MPEGHAESGGVCTKMVPCIASQLFCRILFQNNCYKLVHKLFFLCFCLYYIVFYLGYFFSTEFFFYFAKIH